MERSPEGVRPLTMIARFIGLGGGMEVRPDEADVHVRCVRRVVCGLCAELLGGRGAWRVTLFIVHPHWWAAGSRAGRRDFAPWDVPHAGELFRCAYICHGYYPRAFLVRTQLHRPSGILCSAAGWLAFGIPSACALTCVWPRPPSARSPSLASRARLLAPRPRRFSGCVGLAERQLRGPAESARAGILAQAWAVQAAGRRAAGDLRPKGQTYFSFKKKATKVTHRIIPLSRIS